MNYLEQRINELAATNMKLMEELKKARAENAQLRLADTESGFSTSCSEEVEIKIDDIVEFMEPAELII
jgi:hypothetical protein